MLDEVWLRWLAVLAKQRHEGAVAASGDGSGVPDALTAAATREQPWPAAHVVAIAQQLLTAGLTDATAVSLRDEYVNAVLALAETDQLALHAHLSRGDAEEDGGDGAPEPEGNAVTTPTVEASTAVALPSAEAGALANALAKLDAKEGELAAAREAARQLRLELAAASNAAALLRDELDILRPKAADARRLEASLDRARSRLEAAEVARAAAEAQAAEARALAARVEALTAEVAAVSGARAREASLARVEASGLMSMLAQSEAALAARDKEVEALRAALREKEMAATLLGGSFAGSSVSGCDGEDDEGGGGPPSLDSSPLAARRPASTRLDVVLGGATSQSSSEAASPAPAAAAPPSPTSPAHRHEDVEALTAQLRACQAELVTTRAAASSAQAVAARVNEVEEQIRVFRSALAASEAARDDAIASEQAARVELSALSETLERWRSQRSSGGGGGGGPTAAHDSGGVSPSSRVPRRPLPGLPPTPAELQQPEGGEEGWGLSTAIGSVTAWFNALRA